MPLAAANHQLPHLGAVGPLPSLPDSLLEHIISFLSIKDAVRCRFIAHHYHDIVPRAVRNLQIMLHHVKMVDWEAYVNVQSLTITCEAQLFGRSKARTLSPPAGGGGIGLTTVATLAVTERSKSSGKGEGEEDPTAALKALFGKRSVSSDAMIIEEEQRFHLYTYQQQTQQSYLPALRELVLFGLSLGDAGMEDLWEGLAQLERLTSLNLDGNDLTDVSMERLAEVVVRASGAAFKHLHRLQLSSNHIGDEGAARLLEAFAQHGLTSLDLSDNKLGSGNLEHLAQSFESGAGSCLRELGLGYNSVSDAGLSRLCQAFHGGKGRRLTKLELESNQIGNNGLASLASAMAQGTLDRLVSINLCKNEIGDRGARELAAVLSRGGCLEMARLDLSGNCIASNGAVALALVLASGSTGLKILSLAWNNLADEGAAAFAAEVSRGTPSPPRKGRWLERLELSNNSIGDEGVRALASALRSAAPLSHLESLDLTGNDFHDPGLKALALVGGAAEGCFPHVEVYNGLLLDDLMGGHCSKRGGKSSTRSSSKKISTTGRRGVVGSGGIIGILRGRGRGIPGAADGVPAAAAANGFLHQDGKQRRSMLEALAAAVVYFLALTLGINANNGGRGAASAAAPAAGGMPPNQ